MLIPSLVHHFRREFEAAQVNPAAAGKPLVVPKMVDFTKSTRAFQYDERQQFKQPDWTYRVPP